MNAPSPLALIKVIKSEIARGDKATAAAETHYKAAGEQLATLKELKTYADRGMTWEAYVKRECGISQERADELIRIFNGKTTTAKVRANATARKQKERAKKSVTSHSSARTPITGETRPPTPVEQIKPQANHETPEPVEGGTIHPDLQGGHHVDEPAAPHHETPEEPISPTPAHEDGAAQAAQFDIENWNRVFMNCADEALRHATRCKEELERGDIKLNINQEMVDTARRVRDAWSEVTSSLRIAITPTFDEATPSVTPGDPGPMPGFLLREQKSSVH